MRTIIGVVIGILMGWFLFAIGILPFIFAIPTSILITVVVSVLVVAVGLEVNRALRGGRARDPVPIVCGIVISAVIAFLVASFIWPTGL